MRDTLIPSSCRKPKNNSSSRAASGLKVLQLLERQPSALHRVDVICRIVGVGPALSARKRMCASPETQIRFPPPVLQVVPRFESWLGPVGNLVMVVSRYSRKRSVPIRKIPPSHLARERHPHCNVSRPSTARYPSRLFSSTSRMYTEICSGASASETAERVVPTFAGLQWQTGNQIEANVHDAGTSQNRHSAIDIGLPVDTARGGQLLIRK